MACRPLVSFSDLRGEASSWSDPSDSAGFLPPSCSALTQRVVFPAVLIVRVGLTYLVFFGALFIHLWLFVKACRAPGLSLC